MLHGSRAKGYRNGSDIDFVIYGNNITYKEFAKISMLLDELLIPYKIDLALFNRIIDNDILDNINRVGKIFYLKDDEISPESPQN